jgi:major membrane immunogen (membrane-anchored lipoprotein)
MRPVLLTAAVAALALLAACGDKPQTLSGVKNDVPAFQGVNNQYAAPGWKAGDKISWEQGLKARAQNTQNEYSRTAATK